MATKRITDVDIIKSLNGDETFFVNQNSSIKQINKSDVVFGINNGGTGATTVAGARNALGLGNTDGAMPVENGGTGATDAAMARTNLGITPENIGALPNTTTAQDIGALWNTQNAKMLIDALKNMLNNECTESDLDIVSMNIGAPTIINEGSNLVYYENKIQGYRTGLLLWDDCLIYVKTNGYLATGDYYITATNNLIPPKQYNFDDNGMMTNKHYTVSQNITLVTTDYKYPLFAHDVDLSPFVVTLSPYAMHTISNVIVTMNGEDVTSSAYDPETGVVKIAYVTGDIVITANADLTEVS